MKKEKEKTRRVKVKRGKEADVSDLREKSHVCVMQENENFIFVLQLFSAYKNAKLSLFYHKIFLLRHHLYKITPAKN